MEKLSYKEFLDLSEKLRECFPEGMAKSGGSFKGGKQQIAMRLVTLYNNIGYRVKYDESIKAAKEYVMKHHCNYKYMKPLYFFIWDGEKSTLMDYIENPSDEVSKNVTWQDMV